MNDVVATMLEQAGGIGPICTMTGAKIVYDNEVNSATLVFRKQSGSHKITHLKLIYNSGTDLYDLKGYRYNRKTLDCPEVWSTSGIYADCLKSTCESATGLYFSL